MCENDPVPGKDQVDMGHKGYWTLSSCKPGNGLGQLLDPNLLTFCQTNGSGPHFLKIEFNCCFKLNEIWIYFDFNKDESYTPCEVEVQVLSTNLFYSTITTSSFKTPNGWYRIKLQLFNKNYVKTQGIKLNFVQNHDKGKDTHLRGIKLFALKESEKIEIN